MPRNIRGKPGADKLMYIPNDDLLNYPLCIFQYVVDTQLNEPKLLIQQIRKRYYKPLGTSVIHSPWPPPPW